MIGTLLERLRVPCATQDSKDAADEIERLRTQCGGNCRYWEGRWRDEIKVVDEATAFLDRMAGHLDILGSHKRADECRAMAKKLRGET